MEEQAIASKPGERLPPYIQHLLMRYGIARNRLESLPSRSPPASKKTIKLSQVDVGLWEGRLRENGYKGELK